MSVFVCRLWLKHLPTQEGGNSLGPPWPCAWRGLLAAQADVWCVQQARIPSVGVAAAESEAGSRGFQLHPGEIARGECLLGGDRRQELAHVH